MLDLGLAGKVALVTGGSEGLGRAIAWRLAAEGARVAICARRANVLEDTAAAIHRATGGEVLAIPADVTRAEDCQGFVAAAAERFGRIDILVNNAGTSAAHAFAEVDDADWQADLDLKLHAAIRCIRAALPHLQRAGGGAIVNLTTVGGKAPGANSLPTSVSRAAGIALTKALSKEYAADRIRVNTVCLGIFKTMQWERRWRASGTGQTLDEFYAAGSRHVPLGRMGEPEEVADLVAFLASDRAAYITGASVNIDGGVSAVV